MTINTSSNTLGVPPGTDKRIPSHKAAINALKNLEVLTNSPFSDKAPPMHAAEIAILSFMHPGTPSPHPVVGFVFGVEKTGDRITSVYVSDSVVQDEVGFVSVPSRGTSYNTDFLNDYQVLRKL